MWLIMFIEVHKCVAKALCCILMYFFVPSSEQKLLSKYGNEPRAWLLASAPLTSEAVDKAKLP